MEIEVLSPLANIAAGGSYTFTIDWYAAKIDGPIRDINNAGAIRTPLAISGGGEVTGEFGVFYAGRADLVFDNSPGVAAASFTVSPENALVLSQTVTRPAGAQDLYLIVYDENGAVVDTLDAVPAGTVVASLYQTSLQGFSVVHRPEGLVVTAAPRGCIVRLTTLAGTLVLERSVEGTREQVIPLANLAQGAYVAAVITPRGAMSQRVILGR
jgi:hypothetical protein